MKVNPNSNSSFKLLISNLNTGKKFFQTGEFWALVKKNLFNSSILLIGEKEIKVKNLANLLEGERILLSPKFYSDRIELEILERNFTNIKPVEGKVQFSKTSFNIEQVLENSLSEPMNINHIFSTLKVFFPWVDWNLKTSYFFWDWEEGKGEGFFSPEEKKLILRIFHPTLGNLEIILFYSFPSVQKLEIFISVEKQEVYYSILKHLAKLQKYFIDNGLEINKLDLCFKRVQLSSKGWNA